MAKLLCFLYTVFNALVAFPRVLTAHPARRRPLQCCVGAALLQCAALADVQRGHDGVPLQKCSATSKLVALHSLICI